MEEFESIWDYGLASENEDKIIKFLDKIYSIPIDKPQDWEKEIFDFIFIFPKEFYVS